ncbi:hypothetical protein Glove_557g23 [Diversispora epigaea]|uniref:Uncharacterized protein n=1 Tax=Diversispora epigaea TaxID=1348612 RepID=A0A397GES3_9GLOM|nr:hypothetical protein Glove_557g23 [Diversispora epigaea]
MPYSGLGHKKVGYICYDKICYKKIILVMGVVEILEKGGAHCKAIDIIQL